MRRLAAAAAAVVVALAGVDGAGGQWSGLGTGVAGGAASTLAAGDQPTATVDPLPGTVEVAWVVDTGDPPVDGYEVRAYDATTGEPRPVGGSCAGLVTATTCNDTGAPAGIWRYTVTPRLRAWDGPEGPPSESVVVDATPPAVALSAL